MSLLSKTSSQLANANARQLLLTLVAGGVTLYIASKLIRELLHALFPSVLPGEPNTALLASPRTHSKTKAVTADDLSNAREYDYIIVGTGTAGSVLANRLTEDPNVTVLAIEAGHSDLKQIFSRIPAGFGRLYKTGADYDLKTTTQPHAADRELQWPRGKMLGGCSAINAMIYNKGAPSDYDEWASLGNAGWSYNDVAPYLKKCEGFTDNPKSPLPASDLAQHGLTGPWKTGYSWTTEAAGLFVDAAQAIGIPKTTDFNTSRGIQGVGHLQTFIDPKGQRSSAAVAYLTPDVVRRPNLKIATGQTVTRLIFSRDGPRSRAAGVEMAASASSPLRYLARAKREVLVCAGAVHTPHLLKLSGIGPADELAQHSIPPVADLRGVGANLVDHIFSTIVFKMKIPSLQFLTHPTKSLPALIEWLRFGTGPMTTNVADVAAFLRTATRPDAPASLREHDCSAGADSADLELLAAAVSYINHGAPADLPPYDEYTSLGPILLRPTSRGTVTLASPDPFTPPRIDANYLATAHDCDLLTYGMRLARQMIQSPPYAKVFNGYIFPRTDVDQASDADLLADVRRTCETIYHPMGTAAMGPDAARGAVVDARLRVHGVDGLRVVDASVFPTPVGCHPCAPVIMVGEKAADLIKEDWRGGKGAADLQGF